jgi:hypothetical protein
VQYLRQRLLIVSVLGLALAGLGQAKQPATPSMNPGAKLYVAPMEWGLDRFVAGEIQRQGLPLELVTLPGQADFTMTSLYQKLGSHMISPGHYIQVKIVAAKDGGLVWADEVNDFAVFFGRLRAHGPQRAAKTIVQKMLRSMSGRHR